MFETLGHELLGAVLQRLPRGDVRNARLACRALDAASRSQLAPATLALTPTNTAGGLPNWARFQRIQELNLSEQLGSVWNFSLLKDAFAGVAGAPTKRRTRGGAAARAAAEALSNVRVLDLSGIKWWHDGKPFPDALDRLLRAAPGAAVLHLPARCYMLPKQAAVAAALAAVARAAPAGLQELHAQDLMIDKHMAAAIARMPGLRRLTVAGVNSHLQAHESGDESVWAALPLTQLTALEVCGGGDTNRPDAALLPLPLPQLQVLIGMQLPFERLRELAAGLPQLRRLEAVPSGKWGPAPGAAFAHLTDVVFKDSENDFRGTALAALLPAVERLALVGHFHRNPDLSGLNPTHLHLGWSCARAELQSSTALAGLTRLHWLSLEIASQSYHSLPLLQRLRTLPQLRTLTVKIDRIPGGIPPSIPPLWDTLHALSALTQLHALEADFHYARMTDACAQRLADAAAFPGLRRLKVMWPHMSAAQVRALATRPGLTELQVWMSQYRGEQMPQEFIELQAARGLRMDIGHYWGHPEGSAYQSARWRE